MRYSIIIPVFNKAALTRHCLNTLRPTLDGAGEGEIIVIDNASSDETPRMLAEFPWIRLVRNETNLGFAGANNQGAQMARGAFLVLLNNDTEAKPGWLARMLRVAEQSDVGAVGARLLYPNGTLQHAGAYLAPLPLGKAGFFASHDLPGEPGSTPYAMEQHEYQAVTGACLVTPRDLYVELGGLDEIFWNGYEDVDYCLKVRERGLRVVYAGDAVLTHFESQSGPQRYRKLSWNIAHLAQRWNGRVQYDMQMHHLKRGTIRRIVRVARGHAGQEVLKTPKTTVFCHGDVSRENDAAFNAVLRANSAPIERIVWSDAAEAIGNARSEMEIRGDRYMAFVDARCELQPGWLDELIRQIEWGPVVGAASCAPEYAGDEDVVMFTADARCTLVALGKFPAHERLREFETLDAALADFLIRGLWVRAATRGTAMPIAALPKLQPDALFEERHGMPISQAVGGDSVLVERVLSAAPGRRHGLVSIVMLSWNAPQFTKIALESIRAHTTGDYEIIIVDNGSGPETVEWLRTLADVRVIYNPTNRGFAGGNNQAIAAALGEYVVLLNNDVVVTDGWLDGLLDGFDRVPGLGVSAPRSNRIAGDQIVLDATYTDIEQMHAYAADRSKRYRGQGYMTDRAIGLCLCIDRRVIDEIGGIDERFAVGNFEDDDFCLRVRAAGYRIHVCDDVFIHHFGSQTFAANKVDWNATMQENWAVFAAKWGLPQQRTTHGYVPAPVIRRGFDRSQHYVSLPTEPSQEMENSRTYRLAFAAVVQDERDWNEVGAFMRRYIRAFDAQAPVLAAIAATGSLSAQDIADRAGRLAQREGIDDQSVADILISDETDVRDWLNTLPDCARLKVCAQAQPGLDVLPLLQERSPSALRRLLENGVPA